MSEKTEKKNLAKRITDKEIVITRNGKKIIEDCKLVKLPKEDNLKNGTIKE